jgi:hypothetical protein
MMSIWGLSEAAIYDDIQTSGDCGKLRQQATDAADAAFDIVQSPRCLSSTAIPQDEQGYVCGWPGATAGFNWIWMGWSGLVLIPIGQPRASGVCVMEAGDCQIQTACSLVGLPEYINRYRSAWLLYIPELVWTPANTMSDFSNEKTVYNAAGADQSLSSDDELAWTQEEELKARRKYVGLARISCDIDLQNYRVDSSVLPLLFLGLLVFQLDRMNLASALTAGFSTNIHINQSTINLGNQLMFMGIVVLEIPFNLILQRLGPRKWISAQVCLFGFIAIMQVFVKSRAGFLASRLFLGFAEAGYIPGASYTLSCWYTKRELAKRIAVLFFGMFGGNALSPILATGILKLAGRGGLNGWQWLFLRKYLVYHLDIAS